MKRCKHCGGVENAHFPPSPDYPYGICMCAAPDAYPCGCPGFEAQEED